MRLKELAATRMRLIAAMLTKFRGLVRAARKPIDWLRRAWRGWPDPCAVAVSGEAPPWSKPKAINSCSIGRRPKSSACVGQLNRRIHTLRSWCEKTRALSNREPQSGPSKVRQNVLQVKAFQSPLYLVVLSLLSHNPDQFGRTVSCRSECQGANHGFQ